MPGRVDDICAYREALYLMHRDEHRTRSAAPDGQVHEVDVLRLLCLTETVDYGLDAVQLTDTVRATRDIAAGDIVTFYPGDSAAVTCDDSTARLLSDRARKLDTPPRLALALPGHHVIAGHADLVDANYLGHKIQQATDGANCTYRFDETAVPVVATVDIQSGDVLYVTQTAD